MASTTLPPTPSGQSAFLVSTRQFVSQPVVASFMAGGIAGAVSRTVVSPLERLKILYQVQSPGRDAYKMSIGKALVKIWKEEGWRGYLAGNGINCVRIVPYSAVQFGAYNIYKPFFEKEPGALLDPFSRLICGGFAGITSVIATYPLDIVRTRLSIQTASFKELETAAKKEGASAAEAAAEAASKVKPPGMWTLIVQMYKTEGGFFALYRGIVPTIAGVAPYVGLNFMIYEGLRQYFTKEGEKGPGSIAKLACGAISGAMSQSCTYPLDVLRRRFQVNTMAGMGYKYPSLRGAILQIARTEGLRGFYKGLAPNLLKVAPSMAANWLSYELSREFFISLRDNKPA